MPTDADRPAAPHHLDATTVVPPNLERRLYAAGVDVVLVGVCCGAMFLSFNPVFGSPHPWFWRPAAIMLGLIAAVELLSGITPGKGLAGLTVRGRGGRRPVLWALVARGLVRWAPVALFLVSLSTDRTTWIFVVEVLIVLVGCYLTICYISLWRRGSTVFDAIAGTTVATR